MLPAIAMALHTSTSTAGLLVTAYSIPYGLFQLIYGPIADRIGKVTTILASLCLFAIGTVICGAVHTFASLLILRVITGMFAAGIIPTTLAQIGDMFDLAERPRAIAFFMSFSTTGQAMGIVIGGIVAQYVSYRVLFFILGVAALPTIFTMAKQRASAKAEAVGLEPSESTAVSAQATKAMSALSLKSRYQTLLHSRRAWLVYSLVLCEGLVFYGGFTFLGVYGVTMLHASYLTIGLLTATYSLGAFLGSRTITAVLNRIGTPRMPIFGAGLMTLGFLAVWGVHSLIGLTLGLILLGFGFSYCHSTLQTYATDLLPNGRATAISLFAFSLFFGSGLGPMLSGQVLDAYGMRAMLLTIAVCMAAFGLVCCIVANKAYRKSEGST